jgi:RsiW-degrading membrane proteinase PrsW (M82 family)
VSTGPESNESVPTAECRVCQTDVPAGEYCGLCGCHLTPRRGEGPDWLRIRDFGAAPGEHLLQPSLTSSLFPHLPSRSRTAFRLGLALVLVALVAFTLLRLPGALVTVSALGLPLLFLIYLRESDAFRDYPIATLVLTAALGIGLAVGWVLLTGSAVARSYGVALGSGIVGARMLRDGIGIPLGGVILMLMPTVIVRLMRPPTREALDGFMIGALGALSFTAAATLTRLAPQFGTGVVSKRPMESLMVEAGIRGVAVPLTAAAAGGLIGAALWFTRPLSKQNQRPGLVRLMLVSFAVAVLAVYLGLGLIDVARFPQVLMLVLYLALALVALFLLRVGLQLALLHEAHDAIQSDEPLLCPHCGHVVPDMAFCPACGVATRASSRSSRKTRREIRPVRSEAEPEGP